ncbi:hypothetical protein RBA41_17455 [Massilia sp. CCM 9210]|nr:hypothetical protein [Massilia sp. CCM 9210]MDQ1815087.1 hypothetical protein [Massilia sp. CCM 9210]
MDLTQLTLVELRGLLKAIGRKIKRREQSEGDAAVNEIDAIAHRLGKR